MHNYARTYVHIHTRTRRQHLQCNLFPTGQDIRPKPSGNTQTRPRWHPGGPPVVEHRAVLLRKPVQQQTLRHLSLQTVGQVGRQPAGELVCPAKLSTTTGVFELRDRLSFQTDAMPDAGRHWSSGAGKFRLAGQWSLADSPLSNERLLNRTGPGFKLSLNCSNLQKKIYKKAQKAENLVEI